MKKSIFLLILLNFTTIYSQKNTSFWTPSDTLHKPRRNALIISETAIASGSLLALDKLWYSEYPRSRFQLTNDNKQWKQMDKMGHLMTSYYVGKVGIELLNWSGVSKKKQLIYGATAGFTFLTAVEILDGFSEEWGFSLGDIAANAAGTGLLVGQELLWKEQRIIVKYSFHQTKYSKIRPELLGENFMEQSIKDYNGQTYWLSANIWSFSKESNFPKWINIALGYGAEGMLGVSNSLNNIVSPKPFRQFYISLDVDLSKIKTQSKILQSVFSVINFIKIPAPTLEFRSKGGLKFHYLYF